MHRMYCTWLLVLLAELPLAAAARETAQPMTLDECVTYALQHNPSVRQDQAGVDEALALRRSAVGKLGPTLKADANVMRFDAANAVDFGGMSMVTREQTTKGYTLSATQPLTNLWTAAESARMAASGLDAARQKRRATHNDVAYQVIEGYYRNLEAKAYLTIADKARESVAAHVEKAGLYRDQGLIPDSEYLKARVSLAQVEQSVIEARSAVELTASLLGNLLGLADGQAVETVPTTEAEAAPPDCEYEACAETALATRPELRMLDAQVGAARAARRLAVSQLLPTVAAQASYAYSDGSRFQEKETKYVGGVATWNFWEWGSSRFQVDAAAARLARARVGREQTADLIRLQVRQADLKLKEARESLAVASASIAAAEEALRIERVRFDQQLSTSTDVLNAESLHTAASMRQTTAQYEYLIASAAYRKAVGLKVY